VGPVAELHPAQHAVDDVPDGPLGVVEALGDLQSSARSRGPTFADVYAGRIDREVRDFVRLAEQVEARSSDRVRGYIEGLRSWMRGYREWAEADSTRYSADHAAEDADDTLVGASYAAGRGP
jgi:hypothetical protein